MAEKQSLMRPKREDLAAYKQSIKNLHATGKYLKCPPSKATVRARTIIGLPVSKAAALLSLSPASSAKLILKILNSAVSNASNNKTSVRNGQPDNNYDVDELYVDKIQVDRGRMLKRFHPVSRGMAKAILKRTCHITVYLKVKVDKNDPSYRPESDLGALTRFEKQKKRMKFPSRLKRAARIKKAGEVI
jgi:large subunit ribosomal protein L22